MLSEYHWGPPLVALSDIRYQYSQAYIKKGCIPVQVFPSLMRTLILLLFAHEYRASTGSEQGCTVPHE